MNSLWPWAAVAALGAYHGFDPSMGWLFAVALGLQEHRRSKVFSALLPIGLGHLVSVGLIVGLVTAALIPAPWLLRPVGAAVLILFGLFRIFWPRAHPRWVAMRVTMPELALWSFLMASAHGAGLMLFPIVVDMCSASSIHQRLMSAAISSPTTFGAAQAVAMVLVHTGAMLLVMGTVAFAVYEWVGLKILRSAWINLDALWAGALVAAGALTLVI